MDLIEQLRAAGKGTEEWRVADPADGSYCIAFSWANSINPEREAREWLDDHRKRFPTSQHANFEVRRVMAQNNADLAMCQAADELERLRDCAGRVIEAFETLGRTRDAAGLLTARARCESVMLELKHVLTPN